VVQGGVTEAPRDRDAAGRARNARARDDLGRPLLARTDAPGDDPAALPPQEALAAAQAELDAGRPFAAHEILEAVWKAGDDPGRTMWRGLAQVAVGITHAKRGNPTGAAALLQRGAETLAPYAGSTTDGVDVDGVRAWAIEAAADLSLATVPLRLTLN